MKMYFFVNCCPRTLEKLTNKLAEADVTKRVCGTLASPANKGYLLDRPRPGHHSITALQLSSLQSGRLLLYDLPQLENGWLVPLII